MGNAVFNRTRREMGIVSGTQYDVKELSFINNNLLDIIELKKDYNDFKFTSSDVISTGTPSRRYISFIDSIIKSLSKGYVVSFDLKTRKFITKHFDLLNKMKEYTGHEKIGQIFENITSSNRINGYIDYVFNELYSDEESLNRANELLNKLLSMGITLVDFHLYNYDYEIKTKNDGITVNYLDNLTMIPSKKIIYNKNEDTQFTLFGQVIAEGSEVKLDLSDTIHIKDLLVDPSIIPSTAEEFMEYIQLLSFKHDIANMYKETDDMVNKAVELSDAYEKVHKITDCEKLFNKTESISESIKEIKDAVYEHSDELKKVIDSRDSSYQYAGPVKVNL